MARQTRRRARERLETEKSGSGSFPIAGGVALIVVVTCLAYLPAISGGFVLDDDKILTDNKLIRAADGLYRIWFTTEALDYWPLSNSLLWLEWRLWGMNPIGYHSVSLVLHLAEVLLIWRILWGLKIPGAFLAALLFALHPVNVESVAWITQLKEMLAALFFLLAILWYLKAEGLDSSTSAQGSAGVSYGLSLVAFVLAILSKVSVVILPPILLILIAWCRPLKRRDWLRVSPFFLIAALFVPLNIWFQTHGAQLSSRPAGLVERLLGAGGVIWFYLYKALLPINLSFIYPHWRITPELGLWWLPLLAVIATTAVLWFVRRRDWGRPLLLSWLFFCVALVPVLGFTDSGFMQHSLVADHYQHVALLAVTTLAGAAWATWREHLHASARAAANVAAMVVVAALALLTWQQSRLYADGRTLYEDTLRKNPDSWMAHNNLGTLFSEAGRSSEAIAHFERALQLNPNYAEAHNNIGSELSHAGKNQEAMGHYRLALRLNPEFREAHYNLGVALDVAGQPQDAIEHYRSALRIGPEYPEVHYHLGIALAQSGQLEDAIRHFRRALQLKPDDADAENNLGTVLAQSGRIDEAIGHYRQALRLKPDYAAARQNLDLSLAMQREQSGLP